jgi:hypothetical protein
MPARSKSPGAHGGANASVAVKKQKPLAAGRSTPTKSAALKAIKKEAGIDTGSAVVLHLFSAAVSVSVALAAMFVCYLVQFVHGLVAASNGPDFFGLNLSLPSFSIAINLSLPSFSIARLGSAYMNMQFQALDLASFGMLTGLWNLVQNATLFFMGTALSLCIDALIITKWPGFTMTGFLVGYELISTETLLPLESVGTFFFYRIVNICFALIPCMVLPGCGCCFARRNQSCIDPWFNVMWVSTNKFNVHMEGRKQLFLEDGSEPHPIWFLLRLFLFLTMMVILGLAVSGGK